MNLIQAYFKWLHERKLRSLILAGTIFMLFPLAVIGFASIYTSLALGEKSTVIEKDAAILQDIHELRYLNQVRSQSASQLVNFGDASQVSAYHELSDKMLKTIERIETKGVNPRLMADIKKKHSACARQTAPILSSHGDEQKAKGYLDNAKTAEKDYTDAIEALLENRNSHLKEAIVQVDMAKVSGNRIMILALVFALVFAGIVSLFMRFVIISPFSDLLTRLVQASHRLSGSSKQLSTNSEAISETTGQISNAVNQVAMGAAEQSNSALKAAGLVDHIHSAINQVADGARIQSARVGETAVRINELIDSIAQVSEAAKNVQEVVASASDIAIKGKDAVEETVAGMDRIKETVLDSSGKIQALGEKSGQIGEIIEVIDDIAEQTNLLALNAAIEAARAGEHGKGFAVVADEVRKLAERSASATREIAVLIKGIQSETMRAVKAMEKGTQEVASGSELAQHAGVSIQEMMRSIGQVVEQIGAVENSASQMAEASSQATKAIKEIAVISEENSSATQEVSMSTNQLVSEVDSVAATSEEAAATAEEVSASTQEQAASVQEISAQVQVLAGMSEELDKLVNVFKV